MCAQTLSPTLNIFELLSTTTPTVSPAIGSPIFVGAAYEAPSFIRPLIYGSIERYLTSIRISFFSKEVIDS